MTDTGAGAPVIHLSVYRSIKESWDSYCFTNTPEYPMILFIRGWNLFIPVSHPK